MFLFENSCEVFIWQLELQSKKLFICPPCGNYFNVNLTVQFNLTNTFRTNLMRKCEET